MCWSLVMKSVIELTDQGYVALGDSYIVQAKEAEELIMEVMPTSEADAITLEKLIEASEVRRGTAQKALTNLLAEGRINKLGKGKKGSPYKYWKPEKVSATTISLGWQKQNGQEPTGGENLKVQGDPLDFKDYSIMPGDSEEATQKGDLLLKESRLPLSESQETGSDRFREDF